jgi:glycosyltransferase involved in cell wall biosynthesis
MSAETPSNTLDGAAGTRAIRILRIIDRLNVGGPARQVVFLSSALQSGDVTTTLVTGSVARGEGDMSYLARDAGLTPVVLRGLSRELTIRDLFITIALVRLLRQLDPDIVHTHKAKGGAVGRLAVLIHRLTRGGTRRCFVVHTYHGHVFHSYYGSIRTRLFLAIERALARLCTDRIVTVSERQRAEISETFSVGQPAQFRVVPLGIDTSAVPSRSGQLRREIGAGPSETIIGIVGRLSEVKNHMMFVEAAASLTSAGVQAKYVVIGDGHLGAELKEKSRALGLDGRVVFTGFRTDVLALYGDLDVVALTSLNEGTPLTLIEAMCAGCAIAATEVGGVADIMGASNTTGDGFTIWSHGVTSPSRDTPAFVRALAFLVGNPHERREMSIRGQAYARAEHSRERLLSRTVGLYEELLGAPAVARSAAAGSIG